MISFLLILVVIILAVYWSYRPASKGVPTEASKVRGQEVAADRTRVDGLLERDRQWREYIANFDISKLPPDTDVIKSLLLSDLAPDRIARPSVPSHVATPVAVGANTMPAKSVAMQHVARPQAIIEPTPHAAESTLMSAKPIDGTLLLLYFGAFLFVVAAGLFVAFSGLDGVVRTAIVVLTTGILYMVGLWLYDFSERLRPAGVAFVAISLAIAPLIGVAVYFYVTHQTQAGAIWGMTSLLCLGMYTYALVRLKSTLVSYLLILSFVSLFESAVSILDAPVQYYVWMLLVVGLGVRLVGRFQEQETLGRSSMVSSQVIIPLSVLVSLGMVSGHGLGQLGISLLLAAVFYASEAVLNKVYRASLAVAAHLLAVLGVSVLTYDIGHSGAVLTIVLLVMTFLHAVLIQQLKPDNEIAANIASVAMVAAIAAAVIGYPNGALMTLATAVLVCLGGLVMVHQRRTDAFGVAGAGLIALPLTYGQFAAVPRLEALPQAALALLPFIILWGVWNVLDSRHVLSSWRDSAQALYVAAGVVLLCTGVIEGSWLFVAVCAVFGASLMQAAHRTKAQGWWFVAGLVMALPVLRMLFDISSQAFSVALLLALLVNIGLTLVGRAEGNRWLVALLGLLLPPALGMGGLGWHWNAVGYTYGYLMVFAGLVLCRAIAVGALWPSSKAPIVSYYRSRSVSYVFGYVTAVLAAFCAACLTMDSPLHISGVLVAAMAMTAILAQYVEKQKQLFGLLAWLTIGLLVNLFRPDVSPEAALLVLLAASVIAALAYGIIKSMKAYFGEDLPVVLQSQLLLAYTPVPLAFVYPVSDVIAPVCLCIAALLTLYHVWYHRQSNRELVGGVLLVSVLWGMHAIGITNPQAFTHVTAVLFAVYAYWRHIRDDRNASDRYLMLMLATATIPLLLQALDGTAGDVYGWWLIIEQIGFLILGILIGRRFVTFWGLYVAIGAVLYQLRHLGWAALALLALFVIGLAVYRLTRSDGTKRQ